MAILKKSVGAAGLRRFIQYETLTLSNASTANGAAFQVKKNADFTVFINTGAVNTSAVTTDLEGSHDGTTWSDINASFGADCDTAMIVVQYDSSANGDFPYFRLTFDSVGDDSALDITYEISS